MLIVYERRPIYLIDEGGAFGQRGRLKIGPHVWYTVERLDDPATIVREAKELPPGRYDCELGHWTGRHGQHAPAVRVLGDFTRGRIYLHPGNSPSDVTGCVCPGLLVREDGVGGSRGAMKAVFGALGGFVLGAPHVLEVYGLPQWPQRKAA